MRIALCLEQEGVIVTFYLALIVIGKKFTADDLRRTEIESATSDGFQSVVRDAHFINRQVLVGEDLQLVLAHIRFVTVEVEINVIRQIHRAGLIDRGAVGYRNTIIVSQAILHGSAKMAREALIAIVRR